MFERRAKKRFQQLAKATQLRDSERQQLEDQIARLERTLQEVLDASEGLLADVHAYEAAFARNGHLSSQGFAYAWINAGETVTGPIDDHFASNTDVDLRARRWLLAS